MKCWSYNFWRGFVNIGNMFLLNKSCWILIIGRYHFDTFTTFLFIIFMSDFLLLLLYLDIFDILVDLFRFYQRFEMIKRINTLFLYYTFLLISSQFFLLHLGVLFSFRHLKILPKLRDFFWVLLELNFRFRNSQIFLSFFVKIVIVAHSTFWSYIFLRWLLRRLRTLLRFRLCNFLSDYFPWSKISWRNWFLSLLSKWFRFIFNFSIYERTFSFYSIDIWY